MTPDYFIDPLRVARLQAVCESWLYTPFRQRSCIKGPGGGVDCAGFVPACYLEIGAIRESVAIPPYNVDHGAHNTQSLLRDWFERPDVRRRVRRVDEDEAHLDGDMVFPKVGQSIHHIAIRIGNSVYHVWRPAGVCRMAIDMRGVEIERSRYRLMEALP